MNYKSSDIAGGRYHRFARVVIDNPLAASPSVLCVEQEVLTLGQGEQPVIRDAGNLGFAFDPSESFALLNPATGEPTGHTITGAEVYAGIWSIVMHKAMARDAANAAPE